MHLERAHGAPARTSEPPAAVTRAQGDKSLDAQVPGIATEAISERTLLVVLCHGAYLTLP